MKRPHIVYKKDWSSTETEYTLIYTDSPIVRGRDMLYDCLCVAVHRHGATGRHTYSYRSEHATAQVGGHLGKIVGRGDIPDTVDRIFKADEVKR